MMLSFFKSKSSPVLETDVMEIVNPSYPKVVQEIHHEFLTAGDKLLAAAQQIIANTVLTNEEKVTQLQKYGFHSTKESLETGLKKARKQEQEKIATAISDFNRMYPTCKVITDEVVEKICKKYGLVFGDNSQYKGFVPQKNLNDIERFFIDYPEDSIEYFKYWIGSISGFRDITLISKSQYKIGIKYNKFSMENGIRHLYEYATRTPTLKICAPLKDMDTRGYQLKGHRLVKEIPDPIVLLPKVHENGVKLNIILTAWGDEQFDPLVFNERNN